jgi:hypothetical protein
LQSMFEANSIDGLSLGESQAPFKISARGR